MKYLILEDEALAAEKLRKSIAALRPQWQCLQVIDSVAEAEERIGASEAELIFVDIHLSDGSSIPMLQRLGLKQSLIFTTAYDRYALQAFEFNSIDYLLKPVRPEDLQRALAKLSQAPPHSHLDWQKLLQDLTPRYKERFVVRQGQKLKALRSVDIAYFQVEGKHCFACSLKGEQFLVDFSLRDLAEKLDPRLFFQVNRRFIVQLEAIREMHPYSKARLKLVLEPAPAEMVLVSVERSPAFKRWLAGEEP